MNVLDIDHTRAVKLPFGLTAHFSITKGYFECAWEPAQPWHLIKKPRAKRRFIAAYTAARDDFISDIATMTGQAIAVVNTDDFSVTAIKPGTRQ